ncbi:protein SRG1-like isoform X1 [Benincasa hispida]|uniref:protein SRG1-like isoform X1 n=1 Tax=Benincasa hispida TaxID=102211 RepID=UPI0019018868|nr:protein SRG1-like isoform X1 [Benincasa hispida]XP_038883134.1 protein SRG1-like isoform X1 [Benincasa hispida]
METLVTKLQLADSLPVPCVQELAKSSLSTVPFRYVRPDQDPPFEFTDTSAEVPVIDMHKLLFSNNFEDSELDKLHHACKDWGFFQVLPVPSIFKLFINIILLIRFLYDQVINHGVSDILVENVKSGIQALFNLPMVEKRKLWQRPGDVEGFGQTFVVSEDQKLNWGDLFGMFLLPTYLRKPHLFPNLPLPFRDDLDAYTLEMKNLGTELFDLMAKALKMDSSEMRELYEEGMQSTRMNYYPPCPQPELVMGLNNHSDASAITILLQVNEVEGLQIRKDGKWIPVKPLSNAFVVNIGDVLEIFTNGIYRSIEHRATVNSTKERLSVAMFFSPRLDGEIGPAPSLVTSERPALFKRIGVADFLGGFFKRELNGRSYLDVLRIQKE